MVVKLFVDATAPTNDVIKANSVSLKFRTEIFLILHTSISKLAFMGENLPEVYLVSSQYPTLSREKRSGEPSRISWASGRFSDSVT